MKILLGVFCILFLTAPPVSYAVTIDRKLGYTNQGGYLDATMVNAPNEATASFIVGMTVFYAPSVSGGTFTIPVTHGLNGGNPDDYLEWFVG